MSSSGGALNASTGNGAGAFTATGWGAVGFDGGRAVGGAAACVEGLGVVGGLRISVCAGGAGTTGLAAAAEAAVAAAAAAAGAALAIAGDTIGVIGTRTIGGAVRFVFAGGALLGLLGAAFDGAVFDGAALDGADGGFVTDAPSTGAIDAASGGASGGACGGGSGGFTDAGCGATTFGATTSGVAATGAAATGDADRCALFLGRRFYVELALQFKFRRFHGGRCGRDSVHARSYVEIEIKRLGCGGGR